MGNVLKRYNGTNWEAVGGAITGDTLPIGSEVDYIGENVPAGWEEVDDPSVYSTSEQRIGTWINNKPLYRKIISLTAATDQTITVFTDNKQRVVKISGCFSTTSGITFLYPDFASNGQFQSTIYMTDFTTLNIKSNRSITFLEGYIELLYYKTTD